MLKRSALKLSALLAVYSAASYSFEPYTYGYTPNVAAGGTSWAMSEPVLGVAPVPGMAINGVIYRYTAVKNPTDPFTVSVQNETANGNGYIFRETDDWSGRPGATINKLVPITYSPVENWGDGSIATTGVGSVVDPSVVYSYRIDNCADPQNDPSCPGYVEPYVPEIPEIPEVAVAEPVLDREVPVTPAYNVYDAYRDETVQQATQPTDPDLYEQDEAKDDGQEEEKESMEKALATGDADLNMAVGQTGMIAAMNPVTMHNYYAMTIPGGVYRETVVLHGGEIKDNKRAFRSMANDRLHTEMVEEQWK